MSLTDIPFFYLAKKMAGTLSATVLDGQNERVGHCGYFVTPDGATRSVTHICWATATVTTGDDILCQIESIDAATGFPNGIVAAGRSGTQAVADANDNVYFETALTTPYTISSGSWLAVTFDMQSAGKNLNISKGNAFSQAYANGAWVCEDIVGAATWVKGAYKGNVALKCSDGSYLIPGSGCIVKQSTSTAINTGSNPRYIGNKIQCAKSVRLCGIVGAYLDMDYNITIKLVDSSGNVLKGDDTTTDMSISIDADYRSSTGSQPQWELFFPCPKSLAADTAYYLIYSPDTANSTSVYRWLYESEAIKRIDLGLPTGWDVNHISSPSAWSITEETAWISAILPIFNQIDFPTAGGGAINLDKMGAM